MANQAFVYTELQISVPGENAPWRQVNPNLRKQPGFVNKTWLSGLGNNSLGGFYVFDTVANAQKFVTEYFPGEARNFGVSQTTKIFDASIVAEASRDMNSVHFEARLDRKPGAFIYTEVQVNVPFEQAPGATSIPILKQQPGLLAKTWLAGLHTNTLGGLYAFDNVENAQAFSINYFPTETAQLSAAYTTRVFDASLTEAASRDLDSPFYI